LIKASVDEVLMHHFEKLSSASGGFAPRPSPGLCTRPRWGDFRPSDSLIPWKKSCGRPCNMQLQC